MVTRFPLKAVLWDFDGTLADTRQRNLNVNRRIVDDTTERSWRDVAGLSSVEAYTAAWNRVSNWQELYFSAFGLTEEQCAQAAHKWAPYQLDDDTPVPLFNGLEEVISLLKHFPQAVVSQNDRTIIVQILKTAGVDQYFTAIVGYAEVPLNRQKPAPNGLLRTIDDLGISEPASVLFVGDHETDALCAINANNEFRTTGRNLRVISVAAHFLNETDSTTWTAAPDHRVYQPRDIAQLVRDLCVEEDNG